MAPNSAAAPISTSPSLTSQTLIRQPQETILVLISDLYEGGDAKEMLKRMTNIVSSGVQVIALLALSDEGAPAFDHNHAAAFASLEIPCFACTPNLFPDLMATAIQRQNISQWDSTQGLTSERGKPADILCDSLSRKTKQPPVVYERLSA